MMMATIWDEEFKTGGEAIPSTALSMDFSTSADPLYDRGVKEFEELQRTLVSAGELQKAPSKKL